MVSIEETAEAELAAPAPQEAAVEPITAALAELPALLREAFVLKFVEEWSYDEMVAMTGASESALKMRVARAKDVLRERLREGNDARS